MPETKMHQLAQLGQSIWLDYINRELIDSGKLKEWVDNGLRGMTSNPSIFNQVISKGNDYDDKIAQLKEAGKSTFKIYDELTITDIQDACNIFKPVYEQTNRLDGYVSLEINPQLANDTEASIKEGKRLFEKVNRPNLMIKVPATKAGFPVIVELLANGINVNVTLIFSLQQYEDTAQAYLEGLQKLSETSKDLSKVRSVASVFVSRIDSLVDKLIAQRGGQRLKAIQGQAAVANAQLIFDKFKEIFNGEEFQRLVQKGAGVQRVLWGSTSTKNPQYSDVKYVEELIASPTVNTIPEKTLIDFMDHGTVKEALTGIKEDAEKLFAALHQNGINIDKVNEQLLTEGVDAFVKAFEELLSTIEAKAKQLCPS